MDVDEPPVLKRDEKLNDYFSRTKDFWLDMAEQASADSSRVLVLFVLLMAITIIGFLCYEVTQQLYIARHEQVLCGDGAVTRPCIVTLLSIIQRPASIWCLCVMQVASKEGSSTSIKQLKKSAFILAGEHFERRASRRWRQALFCTLNSLVYSIAISPTQNCELRVWSRRYSSVQPLAVCLCTNLCNKVNFEPACSNLRDLQKSILVSSQ